MADTTYTADSSTGEEIKETPEEKKETIEDIVREVHKDDTKEVPTKEETKEPVKEETKEEPEKEEEPEIDAQEIADAAKEKGKEEIKEEILKALGVTKEQKDEAEDAGWKSPWEKRGESRPKDWPEAIEAGADLAEFRRLETEKKKVEEQETAVKQEEATREQLNKYWDKQLDDLRADGKLPRIDDKVQAKLKAGQALSEEERNDPGLKAQRDIFQKMHEVGSERKQKGLDVIYNLKEIYYEHYQPTNQQPAGEDAPVSGGQKTSIQPQSEEIDYIKDIRSKSFEDIIAEG